MKTAQDITLLLSKHKTELTRKYNIKQIGLFGSYSRGDFHSDRDIDIVVEFLRPVGLEFVDLANELEVILQNKVDLVSRNGIKPKYWKYVEPEVIYV